MLFLKPLQLIYGYVPENNIYQHLIFNKQVWFEKDNDTSLLISLRLSDAYVHHQTSHLFATKPLSEKMLAYFQLDA